MNRKTQTDKTLEKKDKTNRLQRWKVQKERLSHEFIEDDQKIKKMTINQGEIFMCILGENIGDELCNERPVLVISKTSFNDRSGRVSIVPLSSQIRTRTVYKKGQPKTQLRHRTHYRLKKQDFPFLSENSVVMCEQIRTINKIRLGNKLGVVDSSTLGSIKKRIKLFLDI